MSEINIQYIDFPYGTKINETVTLNEDDTYTIFINARQSYDGIMRSYQHAMDHIKNGDFYAERSVSNIEAERHGKHIKTAPAKKKQKRLSRYEAYERKWKRRERALRKLGYELVKEVIDDEYGSPKTVTVARPIGKL